MVNSHIFRGTTYANPQKQNLLEYKGEWGNN